MAERYYTSFFRSLGVRKKKENVTRVRAVGVERGKEVREKEEEAKREERGG